MLVGCIVETKVAKDATSKFNNYVLVNNNGTAEFQSLADNDATIPAGKAFLKNGASSSSGAKALKFYFDDEITGIEESVNNEYTKVKRFFNLSGQRISRPTKGLYIVNGKKVFIK